MKPKKKKKLKPWPIVRREPVEVRRIPDWDDLRSRDIADVRDYLLDERQACCDGVSPEHEEVFIKVAYILDTELRFRDRSRRGSIVVRTREHKSEWSKP